MSNSVLKNAAMILMAVVALGAMGAGIQAAEPACAAGLEQPTPAIEIAADAAPQIGPCRYIQRYDPFLCRFVTDVWRYDPRFCRWVFSHTLF